ncbi:YbcN family protein [Xenorhabdus bovienii]|uniref:YbcN family protein n=1 Tax=Xenorhabdus bovienii TaxID=40576 RepID=UPI0004D59648|nr:YbcN family protein [Xenorhabdus bovienii]CDG89637.1 DLP12 prophage [Xenorhabdus bovienii str. feltiae France]CDG91595.1 DLP12 prophage [Xenorhabdus bovienii str. feltiae Florida]
MEYDFLFHESTKQAAWQQLKSVLATNQPHRIIIKPWKNTRSPSQNATAHMWFGEISRFLKSNGAKFSPDEVKEMMKHTFLGYEVVERVDARTQEPERVRTLRQTSKLDTGEMFRFMEQVEQWAAGMGYFVTIPDDSEYMKLKRRQEQ